MAAVAAWLTCKQLLDRLDLAEGENRSCPSFEVTGESTCYTTSQGTPTLLGAIPAGIAKCHSSSFAPGDSPIVGMDYPEVVFVKDRFCPVSGRLH